jgi:excisionase family DNA binding protein
MENRPGARTLPQVADLLGVSRSTIKRRVADGSIRVIRIGRLVRVPAREIDRLLDP